MLYGHRCRTLLFWNETGERKVFGSYILQEAKRQVRMVRENLRITKSRQKSYADHRWRELNFEVGDYVYLMASPMRGLWCFKVRGKLAPRFIGPSILWIRKVKQSINWNCHRSCQMCTMCSMSLNWRSVCECLQIPTEYLSASEDLSYQEYHVKILETSKRVTWNKKIKMCKVQ
jgi:hypothetical protein